MWHYAEWGTGRPLVLLHGLGMSHVAWTPVAPLLARERRVIAFDIAGFGRTPPLPRPTPPTVSDLVDALEACLHELGLALPIDIAGNSLGGWMALEAGRRGLARRVVAISPAGLWPSSPPAHVHLIFRALRFSARHLPGVAKRVLSVPALRELMLAVPISAGSRRMPAAAAARVVDDLGLCPAFEATLAQTRAPFAGSDIAVPLTVAFGDRDWILTARSRRHDALPPHTRWLEPRGWGHVPMWADPEGVAAVILAGIS
jgi:pimeloyl-ACP methyl ester carboxylesterase